MRSTKLPSWIERLIGLDSEPLPPHVFSVDEEALRYARVELSDEAEVRLAEFRSQPIPSGLFQEGPLGGPLREPEKFRESLGELVSQSAESFDSASLVLPDRWLRLVLTDAKDLPRDSKARREAILWKLRRLVPFRVEELRVRYEVLSEDRSLIGFAIDQVVSQLEAEFASLGIRIGHITCETLAVANALKALTRQAEGKVCVVTLVGDEGYSLMLMQDQEPLLYRYKVLSRDLAPDVLGTLVRRELGLTLSFVEQNLGRAVEIDHCALVAPDGVSSHWSSWLADGFGAQVIEVSQEHLPGGDSAAAGWSAPWGQIAPLVGTALEEVS